MQPAIIQSDLVSVRKPSLAKTDCTVKIQAPVQINRMNIQINQREAQANILLRIVAFLLLIFSSTSFNLGCLFLLLVFLIRLLVIGRSQMTLKWGKKTG
jgi:hypothetical protein